MPRRNRIAFEHRERIVRAFEDVNEDYLIVADTLGVNGSTARILNENCLLTLTQVNQELRQRLPRKPRICDRTVARTLEGMLFRIKLARAVPADRNRPDVI